jgi:GNAT superfamily N-acetyltransferase
MRWTRFYAPEAFLDAAGPLLRASPLVNQIPLGIAVALAADPLRYGDQPPRLYTVHVGDTCVGAVVQTPPWLPGLSAMSPEVAAFAGARFAADHPDVNGVSGPDAAADAFLAAALAALPARPPVHTEGMGLFALHTVAEVRRPAGHRRPAIPADGPLLQGWLEAFRDEAIPADPPIQPGAGASAAGRGTGHFWVDAAGVTVAYATFGRDLEGYVSVGPVYTPPAQRGRGYATALVAEMSALALASGRVGCTLFTDLANPTSNGIYETIGYRRIGTMKRHFLR